jgi:hypothetical protein
MYTLDIYSSVVWSGVIRCREQQSNVFYHTEVDDERRALEVIAGNLPPSTKVSDWKEWEVLYPHITVVTVYSFKGAKHIRKYARILCRTGRWNNAVGRYLTAVRMLTMALEIYREHYGEEHRKTLGCGTSLATALYENGKYKEAEAMSRQTIEISERVLGREHPDTLINMNNLALALTVQGKNEEADMIYRQVLEIL